MRITGVRVEFKKRVSDGNYGFEEANAQYVAELDEGEDPDAAIRELTARGRQQVVLELSQSERTAIRWALQEPEAVQPASSAGVLPWD